MTIEFRYSIGGDLDLDDKPDSARWVRAGEEVNVAGHVIPGGLIYVGSHLNPVIAYGVDPALTNPDLPVSTQSVDRAGQSMGYWPSYSEIKSQYRAARLLWLAGGRSDPTVNVGYDDLIAIGQIDAF